MNVFVWEISSEAWAELQTIEWAHGRVISLATSPQQGSARNVNVFSCRPARSSAPNRSIAHFLFVVWRERCEHFLCLCISVSTHQEKAPWFRCPFNFSQHIIALDFHAVHIKPKVRVKVWIFSIFSGVGENVSIWKTKMLRGMRAGTVWSSAVEGSQIKKSTHWHCFSLFINQIHHNECVCIDR